VEHVFWILSKLDLRNIIDILLVALIIYGAFLMVRGTQAVQLLRGVILLGLVASLFGSIAELTAFNWILKSSGQALLVVVAIILQPELRRALDRLGRAGGFGLWSTREVLVEEVTNEIVSCCRRLSERRHGALIVIERETGLQDHIDTGVRIDSLVENDLLQTIFFPGTALHDGAVIIRGDRVVAASCLLPLAETIVSDVHRNGRIVRHLDERRLSTLLQALLTPKQGMMTRSRGGRSRDRKRASGDGAGAE